MSLPVDLSGRIALVTGSTRGIGWAEARRLAEAGATVIINGHSKQEVLEERAAELSLEFDVETLAVQCDARDPQAIRECYQTIFKRYKRLDVLVNNAGVLEDALVGMVPDELITRIFEINTFGSLHHLQGAARLMERAKSGSIINTTSIVGVHGNAGQIVYASSKAAIIGLTKSAAKELANRGIRVNAVAPGFIDTDMTKSIPPNKFAERVESIKMGRIGAADDIARAVLFFASDLSEYVTGQVLGVDGGMLI